jgi:ribosomal protein S18 acetylase RimI-like enzyme
MGNVTFKTAGPGDLAALAQALRRLAQDLGDPYRAPDEALAQALSGPYPAALARMAERADGIAGVTLFSPVFSTAQGGAGVYVSDLWVAQAERGSGLGRELLRDAAGTAKSRWGATFLKLVVHDDNVRAAAFYRKLGFDPVAGQSTLALTGPQFQSLATKPEDHQ